MRLHSGGKVEEFKAFYYPVKDFSTLHFKKNEIRILRKLARDHSKVVTDPPQTLIESGLLRIASAPEGNRKARKGKAFGYSPAIDNYLEYYDDKMLDRKSKIVDIRVAVFSLVLSIISIAIDLIQAIAQQVPAQ